jgi:hypothetical protein
MKNILFRACGPVTLTLCVWFVMLLVASYIASLGDAWLDEGRVMPYWHAHLNEEYVEGTYSSVFDPIFVLAAFARNFIAFFVGTLLFVRAGNSWFWAAVAMALTFISLYAALFGLKVPINGQAIFLEMAFSVMGGCFGIYASKSRGAETTL